MLLAVIFCLAGSLSYSSSANAQGTPVGTIDDPGDIVTANQDFTIDGWFSKSPTDPPVGRVVVELNNMSNGMLVSKWTDTMAATNPPNRTNFSTANSSQAAPRVTAGSYTINVSLQRYDGTNWITISTVSKNITAQ
jgi:hypothetical protein